MEKYSSISEAAEKLGMTSETLRHYDRIGLAHPSHRDEVSNYRYYTSDDIIRLQTIHALQQMDMPLKRIKEILSLEDFDKIIEFLEEADRKADSKIKELKKARERIKTAKAAYKNKRDEGNTDFEVKEMEERVLLLSTYLKEPSLDNLYSYQRHFWKQLDEEDHASFSFADEAGIYTSEEKERLFAICLKYKENENLIHLPKGKYLCLRTKEEDREEMIQKAKKEARRVSEKEPAFILQKIIVKGILSWEYEIQIPLTS